MKMPKSAPSTAFSKSASAKKMLGDLPPSSSEIFFSCSAALAHDELADLGAAGEGDLAHVAVRDDRRAGAGAVAGDDVDDARRQPDRLEVLGQLEQR